MPFTHHAGAQLYWKLNGDPGLAPLVLLNSIGTDMGSWDRALPHLLSFARVLRMDARGHGASSATPGPYSLELLAEDVAAVMDGAGIATAAVCGVSLGGMTAMALALKTPARVGQLIAACTSARMDREAWITRLAAVEAGGLAAIAEAALSRFFSPAFAAAHPKVTGRVRAGLLAMPAQGYAGCAAAIRDMDLTACLAEIRVGTLVIGGEWDVSTPFAEHGRLIAEAVRGAQVELLDAAHLAQVEAPAAFAAAVARFLRR